MTIRAVVRNALCVGLLWTVAAGVSGCATLAGHWSGNQLQPEMSRDQYKLLRPTDQAGRLVSADLRLQRDGSYSADLNYDGNVEQSLGEWNCENAAYVTFVDKQGRSYGYSVRRPNDQTLELVKSIKGTDAVLTLKKQP